MLNSKAENLNGVVLKQILKLIQLIFKLNELIFFYLSINLEL